MLQKNIGNIDQNNDSSFICPSSRPKMQSSFLNLDDTPDEVIKSAIVSSQVFIFSRYEILLLLS